MEKKNRKEYQKQYQEKNKEKIRAQRQARRHISRVLDREHYYRTKDRHREIVFLRRYKIDMKEYKKLLEKQHNLCAVCFKPELKKWLAVDHSHITGKVRGLLCQNCNRALGLLKDDIGIIESLKNYVRTS